MFILIIGGLYTSIQLYLLLKSLRYVKNLFPDTWKRAGQVFLILFFIWINSPFLYILLFGRDASASYAWQLYGFVYPFYIWITACIAIVILFLAKDLTTLALKALRALAAWLRSKLPSYNPVKHNLEKQASNPGRRRFLRLASAGLALPPLGMATYGLIFGSRDYFINRLELYFPQLPENLRGLKIVQFSDIHCSPYTTQDEIEYAVKIINGENPDLVLLTGDFVPMDAKYIYPCVDAIKHLHGKYGVYASLGNHEEWTDPVLIKETLERNGIPVLRNAGKTLSIRAEKLNLLGVDDSRWGRADIQRALQMVSPGHFNLLMSHQPPFWDDVSENGIDLTLAGHTHGGQIALNFVGGKLSLGQFFHKYLQGLFTKGNSQLFVSTGFGFTFFPIRLNVPPEIVVITLT